ncbi:MAG TPA: outer membrane protein assembly factor BamA [Aliiroseovarius sp.]|nr:outer membrane protein assembly factor BamA [Aliiroseovarius sp.]
MGEFEGRDRAAENGANPPVRSKIKAVIQRLVFILILAFGSGLGLAPKQASAQAYTFTSIQIEGLGRVEAGTVLTYLGVEKGKTVTAPQLNDGYQRLVDSGLFQNVEIIPRGRLLLVRVQERPTINRISIEGNKRLKDSLLLGLIQSKPRYVYSPAVAEEDAAAITRAYQDQGRLQAIVEPRIIQRSNNRVDLVFEVTESRNTEVERLSFVGNRAFSDRRLRRVVETKQAGLLRAIVKADTYSPDRIEFDKQVLRDFYQSRGYVDFQVLSVSSDLSRERDAFFVTFTLREGPRYRFGKITTVSEVDGLDAAEFSRLARIRPGSVYNPTDVENITARMEALATRKGLNFARVEPRITRNERAQTLDVEFVLMRGPRVVVERINIQGNATTLDRVIRNQFRTAEGDPLNPREIRAAAERIRALGFFSDVQVQAREGSGPGNVVVDVDVEEAPTGSFSFGGAYSLSAGFGLSLSFSERNFLGRGQYLNLALTTGVDNGSFSFSFAEPKFLGRDLRLGVDAFVNRTQANTTAPYDTENILAQPSLEFPLSTFGRLGVRAFVASSDITNVTDPSNDGYTGEAGEASQLFFNEAARGRQTGVGLGLTYSYDNRRDGLASDNRIKVRFGTDFGGFGSDYTYAKTTGEASFQTMVMNDQVTLTATVEGGAITSLNGADSRVTDRFFMGSDAMRGFASHGIGPRDLATGDAVGGNMFAVARLEAQFPLGLPEEYGISGGLFADVGSLWGLDDTLGGSIDDAMYLRSVIGASLFWKTPIGPLRFNFTRALNKQSYDVENNFEFTISTQF